MDTKAWAVVPFLNTIDKNLCDVTRVDVEKYYLSIRETNKPNTIHRYIVELRYFFNWHKPGNDFFKNIEVKREKNKLPVDAILTPAEAMLVVQHTRNQRDRALVFLMWDSAARLDELLSLKVKNVQFDKYGGTIKVTGKTGERIVRIIDSVPDLQLWINQHKGKQEDYLFCLENKKKLTQHGAQNIVGRAAKRAGLEKNVHPHLFRHSKLTYLAKKGMGEMELRIFAGWENGSQMPATYLHLSGVDVEDKLLSIAGIKKQEIKEEEVNTNIRICPRCQTSNPFDSLYCRSCSFVLDNKEALSSRMCRRASS